MAAGHVRQDLDRDRKLNLALTHLLEIVGEAAGRVPPDERARHPETPWPEVVALRNRLIHGYDAVDLDRLWAIIPDDLPKVVAALGRILEPSAP